MTRTTVQLKARCALICCVAWWAILSPAVAQTNDQAVVESQLGPPPGTVIRVRGRVLSCSDAGKFVENAPARIWVDTVDGEKLAGALPLLLLGSSAELRKEIAASDGQMITVDCIEIVRRNGGDIEHSLLAIEPTASEGVSDKPDRNAMPSVLGVPYGLACHVEGELILPTPDMYRGMKREESLRQLRWIRVEKVNGCPKKILTELELRSQDAGFLRRIRESKGGPVSLVGYEQISMWGCVIVPQECRDLVDWDAWWVLAGQDTGWSVHREFVITSVLGMSGRDEQAPVRTAPALLGRPFGSVCRVEARIMKAEYREGSKKPRDFECVVEIHSVAGQKLAKPATFSAGFDWGLPSSKQIDELRSRTGSMVVLVGYERVWMRGGPIGCLNGPEDNAGRKDTQQWRIDRVFVILPWLSGKGGPLLVEKQ